YPTAKFCAAVMESSYVEISHELNYKLQRRVPVFVYNSHNDFQQTNIISSLLPEGVGGFTEVFKNRVVIPFDGSYEDFRHVLHHELTHAMTYDLLFGNNVSSLISRQRFFNMPLWLAEGFAEYSSRHGWDYQADMYVRDATINGYLTPPLYLGGFLAYKQGQAMIKYIADKYGEDKLGEIFKKGKVHLTMDKALELTIGIKEEQLYKDFVKEMKRRYWPAIAERKEPEEFSKKLTNARKDGSYFNEKPVFSPDGDKIAIFTDKSDYTEIVLIAAADGKRLKRLVRSARSGDLESLHSYVSGISFSPDGRNLAFVAKSKGQEAIFLYNIEDDDIYLKHRLDYYNIVSPRWSPDGTMIAFSALDNHKRDIFVYYIDTEEIVQVTDDRFDDMEPSWLPNSMDLVFSSDRPHPEGPGIDGDNATYVSSPGVIMPGDFSYGAYNLFRTDLATKRIEPVLVGPGQNRFPIVAPDGRRVAFISNRNGIDNIYIGHLDTLNNYAVTDILTGVRSISWSPDGDKIAYSAFNQGAFDIFLLKELLPRGDNGVLAKTDYALGIYDLLNTEDSARAPVAKADREARRQAETSPAVSDDTTEVAAATDSTAVEIAAITPDDDLPEPTHDVTVDTEADEGTADSLTAAVTTDSAAVMPETVTDTTLAAVDSTATGEAPAADSTKAESDSATVVGTGIYDDEYVFVSSSNEAALDSVLLEIPGDSLFAVAAEEPALFDSIPPLLPSGEYDIRKYKVKFTPDFVGGGFAYDTFFGLRGQTYFVFSDYLGNHQIIIATDLVNSIDQSYIQAYYFNNKRRTSLGAGFFHTKNFYVDTYDSLFSDRFYGVQGFARRPFSTYSRLEMSVAQFFIDRKYHDRNPLAENFKRNSKVTTLSSAWVFDNVLWGYTGPVNGRRFKLAFDGGVNLFDNDDVSFYSFGGDFRNYWHFAKTFSLAFRLSGGASFGATPKRYFLGGTTNWVGSRTLDPTVYEVENLYFADVVTPLRGQKYYDLSGDRYGLLNVEFRFPMIQYFAMKYPLPLILGNVVGAVFLDVGAAWDGDKVTNENIKTGFGWGMRMNLFGFALLRYDLAWDTNWDKVSAHPKAYFSLGADF
ncbi:MAG: hypothetical protein KKA42_04700, partial [candidate division Zixibacteria bacterium]|nr:hypothetical protein [candidate division Zixibacteria bacterium]